MVKKSRGNFISQCIKKKIKKKEAFGSSITEKKGAGKRVVGASLRNRSKVDGKKGQKKSQRKRSKETIEEE